MAAGVLALSSDAEIVREFVKYGSDRAATAFVRKYRNFVYTTALRYVASHDDADDIAQEVFIKALKSLKKFRGDSSLKTWLYRITVNLCINQKRKESRRTAISFDDSGEFFRLRDSNATPDRRLESEELMDAFYSALAKLPEKQRETFALRYFDETPYEDMSQMLGTSVGGLKANYYQAVRKLAKYLKNQAEN